MISSDEAKRQLARQAQMGGGDPDYDGLHQGKDGTRLRHQNVMEVIGSLEGKTLLDFGCGTALFLQSLNRAGLPLPARYIGVDFLAERGDFVRIRTAELGVEAKFLVAQRLHELPQLQLAGVDVAIAIGIMGYPGLHSLRLISRELDSFHRLARVGAVTVPRQMPGRLGEPEMARYDTEDLQDALTSNRYRTRPLHTDTIVHWG